MKILITGGGSEEPIDNVRSICNFSTGKTASFLAESFAQKDADVTALMAEKAVKPENCRIVTYRTFKNLKESLEKLLKNGKFDAVIQAAAVSDYSPETIISDGKEFKAGEIAKIPSGTELVIKMKKNPKLVDSIKSLAGKNCIVTAFKLTSCAKTEERKAAVQKVFSGAGDSSLSPDFVVSNDLSEITAEKHPCVIYSDRMKEAARTEILEDLSLVLYKLILEKQKAESNFSKQETI